MFTWPGFSKAFSMAFLVISLNITRKNAGSASSVLQFLLQVIADGFAFAIRVGCEIDVFDALGGLFQLADELFLAFDDFVARFEAVLDIHRQVLLGKIFDMTEGSFDNELLAQVFVDGFRLCRRFHDYQSFCHITFECGALAASRMIADYPVDVTTL